MLALSSLTILPSTIDLLHLFRLPMKGAILSLAIGCDQLVSAMKRCEAKNLTQTFRQTSMLGASRGETATILITGATGTVGSEVVKRLSAQGAQIPAVTRDQRKADANRLPHV